MHARNRLLLLAPIASVLALTGCPATAPTPTVAAQTATAAPSSASAPVDAPETPSFVSRDAPRPSHPLDITFGGRLRLLGYDLEAPDPVRPGDRLRITWHWACLAPVGVGWRLLTHLDADDRPVFNADNVGEARSRWHPSRWRAGEFIRDEQTIEVPSEWSGEMLRVYVGVWRRDERMEVSPAAAGDATRRARAIELPVRTPAAAAPPSGPAR